MSKFLRSTWFYFILIVLLTIPLCLEFFNVHLINGHDSMAGLIRALSMERYMGHGQFFVRWAPEINWGYGYPMFNFYPPFFSFVSVIIFQLTQNMVLAVDLACALFWVLSGWGMFLLAREFWGDEGGILSAVLYMYAPYHMVDLYVRGAFAEFSAFAFFPFLLYSILKISRKLTLSGFLLGVGSVFGLSLTHNIMSMVFFPIAFAFILFIYFSQNRSCWVFSVVGVFMIGLMMSSFFWLPALIEKKFLNLGFLISMRYDFHKSFISIGQLFWPFNKLVFDNVSFQVGVVHTLLGLITLACLSKIFKINKQLGMVYVFFLTVALGAVFLTLPSSHLVWEKIKMLSFIQFPWRILAIIVFAMSVLSGSVVLLVKNPWAKSILVIVLGVSAVYIYLNSAQKPTFVSHEQSIEGFIAMGEGEYTPQWVMVPPNGPPHNKFELVHGAGQLGDEKSIDPVDYDVRFLASEPSLVCFHSFYFPGWNVYIDGQATPYINNPFGLILFSVPPGDHDIQVVFGSTLIRTMTMMISWLGFILLLGGIYYLVFI